MTSDRSTEVISAEEKVDDSRVCCTSLTDLGLKNTIEKRAGYEMREKIEKRTRGKCEHIRGRSGVRKLENN